MESADLSNRFAYHAPDGTKAEHHAYIRGECLMLAHRINYAAPDCREKSLAITALEEAMMWANAAIARNPEVTPPSE
jgi:hypothetical protein